MTLMSNDLPAGASFLLMVEPPQPSTLPLNQEYDQGLNDLGPWRAVGQVAEDHKPNGWAYRFGVGVATLNDRPYTGLTAVAQRQQQRVRMWILADSDDTYNRYRNTIGSALASIQDIGTPPATTPTQATSKNTAPAKPDPNFGKGISGVYVGVERGLSASAGVGNGPQQVFNPSTSCYENSNNGYGTDSDDTDRRLRGSGCVLSQWHLPAAPAGQWHGVELQLGAAATSHTLGDMET